MTRPESCLPSSFCMRPKCKHRASPKTPVRPASCPHMSIAGTPWRSGMNVYVSPWSLVISGQPGITGYAGVYISRCGRPEATCMLTWFTLVIVWRFFPTPGVKFSEGAIPIYTKCFGWCLKTNSDTWFFIQKDAWTVVRTPEAVWPGVFSNPSLVPHQRFFHTEEQHWVSRSDYHAPWYEEWTRPELGYLPSQWWPGGWHRSVRNIPLCPRHRSIRNIPLYPRYLKPRYPR